ncbi:MAG TPA: hypothetical protein VLA54_00770 [Acidimicrobiia bacterium]|nr:hypothetical protein [Acidimicrobiia bacterium]
MFWLARPNHLRTLAAVGLVLASLYFELRPAGTVPHPYAATALAAGSEMSGAALEWRPIPRGLLSPVPASGILLVDVAAGEPLTTSLVGEAPPIPQGWWSLALPVPEGSVPGREVRLVVGARDSPRVVPGLLVRVFEQTTIEGTTALVAIPEAEAGPVAAAVADGTLTVLLGSAW